MGDSFAITASEGNTVSELDGDDVHATLLPLLKAEDERRREAESRGDTAALGLLMAGVSVPISSRSGGGGKKVTPHSSHMSHPILPISHSF